MKTPTQIAVRNAARRSTSTSRNSVPAAAESLTVVGDVESPFYLYLLVDDVPGVLASVATVLGRHGVSVKSVVQKGLGGEARLVMVVHGVLEWNGIPMTAEGPDIAFAYGLSSVVLGRGEGNALVPTGKTLTFLGVHYRKVDGAARAAGASAADGAVGVGSSAFDGPPAEVPEITPPAQQTTPIVGNVIASPEPVLASNGRNELAYELQLINRTQSVVTVHKLQAFADGKVAETLSGKALEAVMAPYGQTPHSVKLKPGQGAYVLMDVSLPRNAKVPAELTAVICVSESIL